MYLTGKEAHQFDQDGFLLVESLFSAHEIQRMVEDVESSHRVSSKTYFNIDSRGENPN